MLSIRTRTFESDETADIAMSRLDWKIEKVKRLTNLWFNNSTADTAKPWVGMIDRNKKAFKIIQTAPFFSPRILEGNFFPMPIHGQIIEAGQKSRIVLKFRLRITTWLFFIVLYLFPIMPGVLYTKVESEKWGGVVFALIVPALSTFFMILQLNRTENKLMELFRIK